MSDAKRPSPMTRGDDVGFVVAMRTRIWRPGRARLQEWIIVSRWGDGGRYLSLARTLVRAPGNCPLPIGLAPRQTALAILREALAGGAPQSFRIALELPCGIGVAGRFLALHGCLVLSGAGGNLRLHGHGICADGRPWRLWATRVPWTDEFLQAAPALP